MFPFDPLSLTLDWPPSHQFDWEPKETGLIYPHIEDGADHAPEHHALLRNGFERFLKLLIGLEMTFDSRRKKRTKERDKIKGLLLTTNTLKERFMDVNI